MDKTRENRRFGRVQMRREETEALRVVVKMNVKGKTDRGRPKKRKRLKKI